VVNRGIARLAEMLNPAGGFIAACRMIVAVVTFFRDNARRLIGLFNTILDAAADVARGKTDGIAERIESFLAGALRMTISFLATYLRLGNLGEKIRPILDRVRKPVDRVLDRIFDVAAKAVGWVKGAYGRGTAAVKRTIERWLISRPFRAAGLAHTVTLNEPEPARFRVEVASTPRSGSATAALTRQAASRALVDINEVSAAVVAIPQRSRRIEEMARQAKLRTGRVPAHIIRALDDLASVIAACWDKLGFDGEHVDRVRRRRGEAGALGEVGAHKSEQGKRTDESIRGRRLRRLMKLESEHVVPWSWIGEIFDKLYGVGNLPGQKASNVYGQMTTVMIYKAAASKKTNKALRNHDMQVLLFLRRIPRAAARTVLRDQLPDLIRSRMAIIRNETVAYTDRVNRQYGIQLPDAPDEATIRRAMSAQLAEIFSAVHELP
jgi:hypothetical protein